MLKMFPHMSAVGESPYSLRAKRCVLVVLMLVMNLWGMDADARNDLQELVDAGVASGEAVIRIPAGRYEVRPRDGLHLLLKGINDVTIDARGVEMICTETTRAILIKDCENLRIEGLTIDYDPLPFTQGRIVEISDDRKAHIIEIMDGFPAAEDAYVFKHTIYRTDGELRFGSYYQYELEVLADGRLRVSGLNPLVDGGEQIGDIVVVSSQHVSDRYKPHALVVESSQGTVLDGVSIYSSPCFGFFEMESSGSVYQNCVIDRRGGRFHSLNADAFHSKHAEIGPRIIDCRAMWMGDDAVNICGDYYLVVRTKGDILRILGPRRLQIREGDPLEMVTAQGHRLDDGVARSVRSVGGLDAADSKLIEELPLNPKVKQALEVAYEVSLDRAVDLQPGAFIASANRMGSGFQVTGCQFGNNRSRGILIKASEGKIIGNRLINTRMEGIKIGPETHWLEAGFSRRLTIANNKIVNPGRAGIRVEGIGGHPGHAHIEVLDNEVRTRFRPAIRIGSVRSGRVVGNTTLGLKGERLMEAIEVNACEDLEWFGVKDGGRAARPNILFCIMDDASYPHMGAYGTDWVKTPTFDRVAAQGILFNKAYTPNAKCGPSRATVLTGRHSWQLEQIGNHLAVWPAERYRTVFEALGEYGYQTGWTGKGWAPGRIENDAQRLLTGKSYNQLRKVPPTEEISTIHYSANFGAFLEDSEEGRPWAFWFGPYEPHRAYSYGSGVEVGGKQLSDVDRVPAFWPDNTIVRNDLLDYAFEIEYADQQLGQMLALLEERGQLDNTLIVVTADNGMPFPRCKGLGYEFSNHIPLAMMWTAGIRNPGRTEDSFVSFVDFAPTFLRLAGIDPVLSGMEPLAGRDLADILEDTPEHHDRSHVVLGQERHDYGRPGNQGYPIRSIIRGGFLYIHNFKRDLWPVGNPETGYLNTDGSPTKTLILRMRREAADARYWQLNFGKHPTEELYHIAVDPECLVNLANAEAYQSLKASLREAMFADLVRQEDPRLVGPDPDMFDRYPWSDGDKALDFYERYMAGLISIYQTTWVEPTDYE